MRAVLEFDLSNEDDNIEHHRCIKSLDMALALWDIFKEVESDKVEEIFTKHDINIDHLIN